MMQFQFIEQDGRLLATSVDRPDRDASDGSEDGRHPAVIIVHGLTGHRLGKSYHLVEFGRRLAARGIACVRFDQSGCGESTGEFQEHTLGRMIADVRAVRSWAGSQPWCDAGRIGLVGISLGALPAIAADAAATATALALWAPVYDLPEVFGQTARTGLRGLMEGQGWAPYRGLRLGRAFVEQLGAVDTEARLADSAAPLLLCHSRADDIVGFEQSRRYERRCAALGRSCELVEFERSDHDFTEYPDRQRLLGTTELFFARQLGE